MVHQGLFQGPESSRARRSIGLGLSCRYRIRKQETFLSLHIYIYLDLEVYNPFRNWSHSRCSVISAYFIQDISAENYELSMKQVSGGDFLQKWAEHTGLSFTRITTCSWAAIEIRFALGKRQQTSELSLCPIPVEVHVECLIQTQIYIYIYLSC